MATRIINGREYTKADFENKLRHLSDAQEDFPTSQKAWWLS